MKPKRRPPTSRHNRKPSMPVMTLDEQLELAEEFVSCSGVCDCSSMGGLRVMYFTIVEVNEGLMMTIREVSSRKLKEAVDLWNQVVEEVAIDEELESYVQVDPSDLGRN